MDMAERSSIVKSGRLFWACSAVLIVGSRESAEPTTQPSGPRRATIPAKRA